MNSGARASVDLPDFRDVPVWIYGLVDVSDGLIRYVGKSANPKARLANHRCAGADAVRVWIGDVESNGGRIIVVLLERVAAGQDVAPREAAHIAAAKSVGATLNVYLGDGRVQHVPIQHAVRNVVESEGMAALRATGLSQGEIGRRLGTLRSVVNRWLSGRSKPSLTLALAAQAEFGIPMSAWDAPAVRAA